ncbi:hypothetical protein KI387_025251, partial [Taxus chinensis]
MAGYVPRVRPTVPGYVWVLPEKYPDVPGYCWPYPVRTQGIPYPYHVRVRTVPIPMPCRARTGYLVPALVLLASGDAATVFFDPTLPKRISTVAVSAIVLGCVRASLAGSDGKLGGESSLVVCFGEMLIDFVPTVGGLSLAEAPAFKKAPGGAPANVAVSIARLGGSSAFIGKVGEDEFGFMLADILEKNNVNNKGMRFDAGARTALAFVTLRADGEREFMFYRNPSADMLLSESELEVDLIKQAKIFHYGSISLIAEPCKSAHLAAMKIAKDAGVLLSYDPNLRLPLWPSAHAAREGILSIWDSADIIKVSEEEIDFLTEGEDPDDDAVVRKLFHPNLKLLLVTEGQEGSRYYTK